MSTDPNNIPVLTALTAKQVADYLKQHPDFLADRPTLLADLDLPHDTGGKAVSLVEKQVSVLRDRNMDMRHRLNKLLANARVNDLLFDKTKHLLLALLDTKQLDDCLDALFYSFQNEFKIHYSRLILVSSPGDKLVTPVNRQARVMSLHSVNDKLPTITKNHRAICGQLSDEEKFFIFQGDAQAIGSTAIAPLIKNGKLLGLVAIANRDPNYYRSSMNTLFLNFIADVLARLL
ncbi:MAG: DUF484 family protein [Pseudomonadota bacterium]